MSDINPAWAVPGEGPSESDSAPQTPESYDVPITFQDSGAVKEAAQTTSHWSEQKKESHAPQHGLFGDRSAKSEQKKSESKAQLGSFFLPAMSFMMLCLVFLGGVTVLRATLLEEGTIAEQQAGVLPDTEQSVVFDTGDAPATQTQTEWPSEIRTNPHIVGSVPSTTVQPVVTHIQPAHQAAPQQQVYQRPHSVAQTGPVLWVLSSILCIALWMVALRASRIRL